MANRQAGLDHAATCIGLLLGVLVGGVYALANIGKSGHVRRKDLASFGGATIDLEVDARMTDAKAAALNRLEAED